MPTVPRLTQQVEQAALPGVRVPVSAPRGAFDKGPVALDLSGAVKLVAEIATQEREKADRTLLADAEASMAEEETRLLFGDDPQNPGLLTRRGKDAFATPEQAEAAWSDAVERIVAGVPSDRVKEAVRRSAQQRFASINGSVQRHVAGERQTYAKATTQALVDNERVAAAANYLDNDRVAASIERQTAAVSDFARDNGLPPEAAQQLRADAVSKTRLAVLERYTQAGDHVGAAAYYAAHKDDIAGDARGGVEKILEQGQRLGAAQAAADAIFDGNEGIARGDAQRAAREIPDPDTRADVENLVRQRLSDRDAAERDARADASERVIAAIDAGRQPNAADWSQLKPSERSSMRSYQRGLAGGAGSTVRTDWARYYELKTMAADPARRAEFMRLNILGEVGHLGPTELKEAMGWKTKMLEGKDAPGLRSFRSTSEQVNESARAVGIDPTSRRPGDREALATFRRNTDERLQAEQQARGRELTPAETQAILDQQTLEVFVEQRGTDPSRRAGQLAPDEIARSYVPFDRIPAASVSQIRQEFRLARGRAPTTREIERAAAAAASGDTARYDALMRSPFDGPR